jgi:hypothetical protein
MNPVNSVAPLGWIAAVVPPLATIGLLCYACIKSPQRLPRHEPMDPTARVALFAIGLFVTACLTVYTLDPHKVDDKPPYAGYILIIGVFLSFSLACAPQLNFDQAPTQTRIALR